MGIGIRDLEHPFKVGAAHRKKRCDCTVSRHMYQVGLSLVIQQVKTKSQWGH